MTINGKGRYRAALLLALLSGGMHSAFAVNQCEGIYGLAKSAQHGFGDMTGILLFQNDRGASYQATYSMPQGDCKVFRGKGLAPTYECVWDFREQSTQVMRERAQSFAKDIARCTRATLTERRSLPNKSGLAAEWETSTKNFGQPVNFTISAVDVVSKRGERIREISFSVEKK